MCFNSIGINSFVFREAGKYLVFAASSYENEILRNLIHQFKYNHLEALGAPLGRILIRYLETVEISLHHPVVIPIPLHPRRLRSRGFNQAEELARIVGSHLQLPVETGILKRIKNTKSQIGLKNHDERRENIKNCFEVSSQNKEKVKNRNVLLVDDVYTSGATVEEAEKVLRRAGVKDVKVLVLAKAG
ncbi:MAG: ComF family protein [Candidatus Colwellbacteria bacterium]|nr:ComF family protein [Candidatus Colwellbacteria bacterium]